MYGLFGKSAQNFRRWSFTLHMHLPRLCVMLYQSTGAQNIFSKSNSFFCLFVLHKELGICRIAGQYYTSKPTKPNQSDHMHYFYRNQRTLLIFQKIIQHSVMCIGCCVTYYLLIFSVSY